MIGGAKGMLGRAASGAKGFIGRAASGAKGAISGLKIQHNPLQNQVIYQLSLKIILKVYYLKY